MLKLKYIFNIVLVLLLLTSCSCEEDGDIIPNEPEIIVPSNLVLTIDIIGLDNTNPNGDGSGTIQCTATATNAVKYGFKFGNNAEIEDTDGSLEHIFTNKGTNNYLITVFAYSSTGQSISTFKSIDVYVTDSSGPQLIWSDEFNTDGAPNSSKWTYNTGNGCPNLCGWGNNESQYYTDRAENVKVEGGVLKITAKKESYQGAQYTSARLLTKGKFNFTYGTVEVRAKLPESKGTWPAIWLLGSNIDTVGWPVCGEIDIMEQTGDDKNKVLGTCHWSDNGNNASYGLESSISNASTEFHIYSMEWTETYIKIFLDNVEYYEIALNESLPFNKDFFLILNIAMGGTLGGTIDSGFTQDTMEIDYIRVYQ
ncbi:glycoside hydrolase family 16 protein [Seonamhaeicola sediminis]|uniref:Glycoside hydrolase family 16 protein n=1 Tax=Seonamhaeicola sediminis TaxID=2528206 RepID=A0A562YGS8_9FLAO|nr:glycoside hydrolase family 16 protein [Seonamhaeicola sediminis]TWO34030.1 glycoside hydrolase family 16 protein [Seonamhaeicola sediminis]